MNEEEVKSLKTIGWVSYILHLIVAVGAVMPGAQASLALLLVALVIDLVKKDDAQGSWQASHFSFRIRTRSWALNSRAWRWVVMFWPSPGWPMPGPRRWLPPWARPCRDISPPIEGCRGRARRAIFITW